MSIQSKKKIPAGMLIFLMFLLIFTFKFVKVTLDKNIAGNLSYVQLLNSGMPLIKATYYDEDAYIESNVTLKSLVLETLNVQPIDPIDLAVKQIPYFSSLDIRRDVEKTSYLDNIKDLVSFNLNDTSIDKISNGKEVTVTKVAGVYDPTLKKTLNQAKPEVLIYHTHTTEGYGIGQSSDESSNVVGVGSALAKELEENYGISVIHDKTIHSTSYEKSYENSRKTVEKYINTYGDFKMVIDLHRDAVGIENKNSVTANLNGENVAKIMFVVTKNNPNYEASLKLANSLTNKSNELFPGLWRGKLFTYNRGIKMFNQDFSKNSVLVEVGAESNSPKEAINTSKYLARIIAEQINRK